MAALTLADVKSLLRDRNLYDTSARSERDYVRIANAAAGMLRRKRRWAFDKRMCKLIFQAERHDGTVSINAGAFAVTGVGTSFVSADVSSFIRFNGEVDFYSILSRASPTSLNIGSDLEQTRLTGAFPYQGAGNLSGVAYSLFCPRALLPTNFRCLERPTIQDGSWRLDPCDLADMRQVYKRDAGLGTPENYAIEFRGGTSTPPPVAWLWVYPGPSEKHVLDLWYYGWPDAVAADGDYFGLPDTPLAGEVLLQYALAFLEQQKGEVQGFQVQVAIADKFAAEALGDFVPVRDVGQRRLWRSGSAGADDESSRPLAAGEPVYE